MTNNDDNNKHNDTDSYNALPLERVAHGHLAPVVGVPGLPSVLGDTSAQQTKQHHCQLPLQRMFTQGIP